jgi:methionyl-tRNA formyltransferase
MTTYALATIKPWNLAAFQHYRSELPGDWHLFTHPDDLTVERLEIINPRYLFFPHWSWKVPPTIFNNIECILFHMTDVPYGRGGSPLQNLILRKHLTTKVSALRMMSELDAGPVYAKKELSLDGSAEEIFERLADCCFSLIKDIIKNEPSPIPQTGDVVSFSRRKPAQSELPVEADAEGIYDHIRMLDADGYPKAFLEHNGWRLEFDRARMEGDDKVTARVRFVSKDT